MSYFCCKNFSLLYEKFEIPFEESESKFYLQNVKENIINSSRQAVKLFNFQQIIFFLINEKLFQFTWEALVGN